MDKQTDINSGMSGLPLYSGRDITLWDVVAKIESIEKKLDGVEHAITGNGRPMEGLAVRVSLLETALKEANRRALYHTIATSVNVIFMLLVLLWIFNNG